MDENNPRIKRHAKNGGLSAIYENGFITVMKGDWKIRITKAVNVPLTYGRKGIFHDSECVACGSYRLHKRILN